MNKLADDLRRILRGQLEGHKRLLACIDGSREAVRKADMQAIEQHCRKEHEIADRLAELEKARLQLVGALTATLRPQSAEPLTLTQIAEALDDPRRRDLLAVADELRATVDQVRRRSSVVRAAAEALARHMDGLVQTVQAAFSRAQVYGRRGRIATAGQRQFCIDVKS